MAKYESGIKQVPYSQEIVYAKLSDLTNLAALKDKMNNPDAAAMAGQQVSEEQMSQAREMLEKMEATTDTLSVQLPMVGNLVIRIIEREEPKLVKFASEKSPIPITLWIQLLPTSADSTQGAGTVDDPYIIQLLPTSADSCKMRVTLEAELNFMFKAMIGGKLKDGVDKFADMLASIPYGK